MRWCGKIWYGQTGPADDSIIMHMPDNSGNNTVQAYSRNMYYYLLLLHGNSGYAEGPSMLRCTFFGSLIVFVLDVIYCIYLFVYVCVRESESNPRAVGVTLQSRKKRTIPSFEWSPTNCTAGHWHHQNVRLELAFPFLRTGYVDGRLWSEHVSGFLFFRQRKENWRISLCVCVGVWFHLN